MTEIEVKKAYNLIIEYCYSKYSDCDDCILYNKCSSWFAGDDKFDIEEGSESDE